MVRSLSPEKKANFFRAALALFVAQGVTNTSTAEIAREAGTAAGTLFLYFPTKQALLDALILKIAQEQSDAIHALLQPGFSARETFAAIWHGTLDWFIKNIDAFLFLQQVRDSGLISESAVQQSFAFFDYYALAIQKGLEERSIKPYPAGLLGDFLYHDIVAVMNAIRREPDAAIRAESIRQGFDIYWDGIQSVQNSRS